MTLFCAAREQRRRRFALSHAGLNPTDRRRSAGQIFQREIETMRFESILTKLERCVDDESIDKLTQVNDL